MPCRVIVGLQWGDEGKGKIVDVLAGEADVVVRYQGGGNAGHTVEASGEKYVLHLVPSGILRTNTRCLIAAGAVVDPELLLTEIAHLESRGHRIRERLVVSLRAHLVLPTHKSWDVLRESRRAKIGTTGRGIGPCYADKASRTGVRLGDLRHPDLFADLVRANVSEKNEILKVLYQEPPVDVNEVVDRYLYFGERLKPYIGDAERELRVALREDRRVLGEGAQGILLDIDAGTYPFVTASSAGPGGLATGAGVPPRAVSEVIGVAKAYVTRVGEGPFPTELGEKEGAALREKGREFGATTGRPRRCGWFDAVAARYAVEVGGVDALAITKLDILTGQPKLRICTAYRVDGRELTEFPDDVTVLARAEPVYRDCAGFTADLSKVATEGQMPKACRDYLDALEAEVGVPVAMVSTGPDRQQILLRGDGGGEG